MRLCHESDATRWIDIGTTNRGEATALRDFPLFRVTCDPAAPPHPTLGSTTHDPVRALVSSKCGDVGAVVVPQLRGRAARAPYFSNGSARDPGELVDFYDRRFSILYTKQERQDLLNFLEVL